MNTITHDQLQQTGPSTADMQAKPAGKKKVSWWPTIWWMLSMVLLVNVVMAIIAYLLFHYHVI